jgi:hypothetical protein
LLVDIPPGGDIMNATEHFLTRAAEHRVRSIGESRA